jgi:hypothetical protein
MVASMHTFVAIQTGPIKDPIVQNTIYRLIRLVCTPRIKLTSVPLVGVTSLAEIGRFPIQEGYMGRSMRGMASETVFYGWGMFPQKGASHVGMTFQAFQIDVLGIHQLIGNGSVRVVAIPALDLPFPYRMAGSPKQLAPDRFMTLDTNFDLGGF